MTRFFLYVSECMRGKGNKIVSYYTELLLKKY